MSRSSRREFLGDVGRGMMIAGVGSSVAAELGFGASFAEIENRSIRFGKMEPLVALMQETPLEKLQPLLIQKLKSRKTNLKQLVTAASLANARTFGGEDYVGFHTAMALVPALEMAQELPLVQRPLPVLKVLYRNTAQIQKFGGPAKEVLHSIEGSDLPKNQLTGELLREETRGRRMNSAERIFKSMTDRSTIEAYNKLQYIVHDDANVHRVALAHRAWEMIDLVGKEQAHTMLRQSVRFCVKAERNRVQRNRPEPGIRKVLPRLLSEYKLLEKPLGKRMVDDAWIGKMAATIYSSTREQAAEAVAAALAEGISPEAVGEAISLAANQLLLTDTAKRTHGASVGVHACDSVNAWRNIARVTNQRNAVASIVVAAWHVALNKRSIGPDPLKLYRGYVKTTDSKALLKEAEKAIRANEQKLAAGTILKYCELGYPARPVFDLMLKYAISEDGRLHSEKYYRTVVEEYKIGKPKYRLRHLVSLARVTASAFAFTVDDRHGYRAPGYEQALDLLKLT